MTGMFLDLPELSGKQIGLLKEVVPRLSRIAIIGIPGLNATQFAAAEMAVRVLALETEILEVRGADDFEGALEAARIKHVDAGILLSSPPVFIFSKQIGGDSQAAPPHFLVRQISKIRRPHSLWAERS